MSDRQINRVRPFLVGLFKRAFRPRPKIKIGEWAERENVMIPAEESHGVPGAYREDTEPVATIIHEFLLDPRYRVFIGPKPSRIGFTLAAMIGVAYWIAHYASNIIFCIDDQKQVKKFATTRLIPLLKSIKALSHVMPDNSRRLTKLALFLKGITLHLAGAKSISDVTSITAGLVIGDEVDQWKDFASGEASAFHHLLDRIMDVPGAKGIFFGKPRNETDILWTEMMTGTRHKCFVPCPHCGFMQTLVFENMKFDHCQMENGNYDLARVLRETYYLCASPECQLQPHGGKIYERHKPQMLKRREWRQTYFGDDPDFQLDPGKMSIMGCGQQYSLRPELTWGEVAKHFIISKKQGGAALAHYFRTRWGEPERKAQAITKKEEIINLSRYTTAASLQHWWKLGGNLTIETAPRKPYHHGHCPFAPTVVLMFCDVQTVLNEKKWVKCGMSRNGECAVIDYGIFMSFAQLIIEADKPVIVADWGDRPEIERVDPVVSVVWIDEGGSDRNEIAVREFCVRPDTFGRFFPSKGAGGAQLKHVVEEKERIVPMPDGGEETICAYHFSHDTFASELFYARIKKQDENLLAIAQGIDPDAQPLWIPEFPDDQFVTEMCSEILVKKRIRGRWEYVWEKTGKRVNDFPDGVKGCLAMWHFLKPVYLGTPEDEEEEVKPRGRDYELVIDNRD